MPFYSIHIKDWEQQQQKKRFLCVTTFVGCISKIERKRKRWRKKLTKSKLLRFGLVFVETRRFSLGLGGTRSLIKRKNFFTSAQNSLSLSLFHNPQPPLAPTPLSTPTVTVTLIYLSSHFEIQIFFFFFQISFQTESTIFSPAQLTLLRTFFYFQK